MFDLSHDIMKVLDEVAPGKCPSYEFIMKLTMPQARLFVETCMLGDGTLKGDLNGYFIQNECMLVDVFEFTCALLGIPTNTINRHNEGRLGRPDFKIVDVLKRNLVSIYKKDLSVVDYDGVVWCPVTKSGTWLAKRKGTVYFTGNSVINKLYNDWINPIVYQVKCHVYATSDVDSLDKNEKDPEILSLYGKLRVKASGQKAIGGQMHTLFLFIPGTDRWLITTVKDRANREYFKKVPLRDLYTQYLFAKAGWPMVESEE